MTWCRGNLWRLDDAGVIFSPCVSVTLVMCVVVVVHRDSEVIVWAVINTPGSPSPLPSNWQQRRQKQVINCLLRLQNPSWTFLKSLCHHLRSPKDTTSPKKRKKSAACTRKEALWKKLSDDTLTLINLEIMIQFKMFKMKKEDKAPVFLQCAPVQPRMWWSWFPYVRWALLL